MSKRSCTGPEAPRYSCVCVCVCARCAVGVRGICAMCVCVCVVCLVAQVTSGRVWMGKREIEKKKRGKEHMLSWKPTTARGSTRPTTMCAARNEALNGPLSMVFAPCQVFLDGRKLQGVFMAGTLHVRDPSAARPTSLSSHSCLSLSLSLPLPHLVVRTPTLPQPHRAMVLWLVYNCYID